jgi:lipopolysaccharide export system protein LptA
VFVLALPTLAYSQSFERDVPVLMTADELLFDDELGIATAKGNVEISQSGRVLLADTVSYNQRDDVVSASGNVINCVSSWLLYQEQYTLLPEAGLYSTVCGL